MVLLIVVANTLNAQSIITGTVLDKDTNEPLAYVNIGIENSNLGTVSDENGNFELKISSTNDLLVFSYLGYQSEQLAISLVQEHSQIFLKPSPINIDEINIVSTNFDKELILGVRNENGRGRSVGFGNAQLGTELGALIEIKKETLIKSANFVLNHAKGDSLLLRLNIYNYENGKIGDKVLQENIYIKEKQRTGLFTIDLESYELLLTNDVLLTVEWLRDFGENGNKSITFDTKKAKKLKGTFIRVSKTKDFIKLPIKKKYKPCIYFVGKQSSN